MTLRSLSAFAFLALISLGSIRAAELAGSWTAEFDSQIGEQKYVYEFKHDTDRFSGKAKYDHSMGKGESQLKEIKLDNDSVSFVETLVLDGMELVITYTGKVSGDQMELKRVVGDFATEQVVAKRAKASTPASE